MIDLPVEELLKGLTLPLVLSLLHHLEPIGILLDVPLVLGEPLERGLGHRLLIDQLDASILLVSDIDGLLGVDVLAALEVSQSLVLRLGALVLGQVVQVIWTLKLNDHRLTCF